MQIDDGAIPARFRTAIATALSPPRSGALLVAHVLSRSIHRASRAPPPCLPYATAALLLAWLSPLGAVALGRARHGLSLTPRTPGCVVTFLVKALQLPSRMG